MQIVQVPRERAVLAIDLKRIGRLVAAGVARRLEHAQRAISEARQNTGRIVNGVGADPDIIVASAKAYLSALNKLQSKAERVAAQG